MVHTLNIAKRKTNVGKSDFLQKSANADAGFDGVKLLLSPDCICWEKMNPTIE